MSLLTKDDYFKKSKKNKVVSPHRASHGGITTSTKIRLPSQHKSPNHKCSQCTRTDAKRYTISEKEVRWLCIVCVNRNKNKNVTEKPNFIRASKLIVKN